MDTQTTITLLTITVVLLSTVMVVTLGIAIAILLKLRKIANNIDGVLQNLVQASEWLTPTKALGQIVNLFRK
jgi:ABC-type molybdate transport system permease subunit